MDTELIEGFKGIAHALSDILGVPISHRAVQHYASFKEDPLPVRRLKRSSVRQGKVYCQRKELIDWVVRTYGAHGIRGG